MGKTTIVPGALGQGMWLPSARPLKKYGMMTECDHRDTAPWLWLVALHPRIHLGLNLQCPGRKEARWA